MKRNTIIKWILLPAVAMACATAASAQDFNTHESIREQLKKGTVQGLKYGAPPPARKPESHKGNESRESLITQLRNGTLKGANFAKGGSGSARSANFAKAGAGKRGSLASEQPAGAAGLKQKPAATASPAQGNAKEGELFIKLPGNAETPKTKMPEKKP